MGKPRAQIQREYRERKKAQLGEDYCKSERARVRKYYVPSAELSNKKRKERNLIMKAKNRRCRERRKNLLERLQVQESGDDIPSESGYGSQSEPNTEPVAEHSRRLIVSLPAISVALRAKGSKKARSRALARAHKSIGLLEKQKVDLERKLKTKSKQLERLKKKMCTKNSTVHTEDTPAELSNQTIATPRTKTNREVEQLRLTPKRRKLVAKKLLLTNVLLAEVKDAKKTSSRKKHSILHKVVAGKVSKKYRCMRAISFETGLSRNSMMTCKSKTLTCTKEKRRSITQVFASKVEEFLSREDNCRVQPGKADVKRGKQTKVLTDYMRNLLQKFLAENPEIKMSLATFCRLRPKHILLARFISRNACQCLKHQNMALKVQAMRKVGIKISENPEHVCANIELIDQAFDQLDESVTSIKFRQWKKVDLVNKQKKMMVVEIEIRRSEFIALVKGEMAEFCKHVERLRTQYKQLKLNKEKLKDDQVIVQMDFAENYTCRALDEVQTAYWSLTSVTLHPTVVYYKEGDTLKHKSFVVISNTLVHSASTVAAFMDVILPEIKIICPSVQRVHYWTDSPSSQYRNRFMFYTMAHHRRLYGCDAQMNFFEAGHGKSACDGIGGTTKRMADEASRQGNTLIQNAEDFYQWACKSTMKDVKFLYVDKKECEERQSLFAQLKIKPVRNTMKLHAIALEVKEDTVFKTKITSCYCDSCVNGHFCDSWENDKCDYLTEQVDMAERNHISESIGSDKDKSETDRSQEKSNTTTTTNTNIVENNKEVAENDTFTNLNPGDYVVALYEEKAYVGKVLEIDLNERDCQVSFMEKAKDLYRWPLREDILWVNYDAILLKIEDPQQTGKSKRLFKIRESDKDLINQYSK